MPCGTFVSFVHVGFTETLERSGDGVDGTPSLNASLAAAAPEVAQGDVQRALGEGDAGAGDTEGARDHASPARPVGLQCGQLMDTPSAQTDPEPAHAQQGG
jgi:hypothetical protein